MQKKMLALWLSWLIFLLGFIVFPPSIQATDYDDADQLYGWDTSTGQFWQTWADHKSQLSLLYQGLDSDLTIYAGITPSSDVQTMLGSANNAAILSNIGAEAADANIIKSGEIDSLAELNAIVQDATLLDDGAIADSVDIGLDDGSTYTSYGAASDDSLNELFAAVDVGITGITGDYFPSDTLADLQARSPGAGLVHLLGRESDGDGGEGIFRWDPTDLSSTLVLSTVTTTAVNDTTETCTKTAHGLVTGDGGVSTTAVNGLSTNTVYWVIKVDADNFRLASSYNNAHAGTAIDLTGTVNFTFKELLDPLAGVYATGTSDLTGTGGAWVRQFDNYVYPEWFGGAPDGVVSGDILDGNQTDSGSAITAAYRISDVWLRTGNWYSSTTIQMNVINRKIYGQSRMNTIVWFADGITGFWQKDRGAACTNLLIRCNRAISGTWSSTDAVGFMASNANPATTLIAYVVADNLRIERFYTSVQVKGSYWVELNDVETICDYYGFDVGGSSFVGTTLRINRCWAKGTGGYYSTPTGSRGFYVDNWTDININTISAEKYEKTGYFHSIQTGTIDTTYEEGAKYGFEFHTLSGPVWLRGTYAKDVGDAYAAGGWTKKVSYGTLLYTPGRFVSTDNSIDLGYGPGKVLTIGGTVDSTTGHYPEEYSALSQNGLKIKKAGQLVYSNTKVISHPVTATSLTSGVDKTVVATITLSGAPSSWATLFVKATATRYQTAASSGTDIHEMIAIWDHMGTTVAAGPTYNVYGSGVVAAGLVVNGATLTLTFTITAESATWGYILDFEVETNKSIVSVSYTQP